MKAVDFYKLPRAIQDRFVGSVMSGFPPAPMLATKGGTPTKLVWIGLSVLCLLLVVVLTRLGYGSLESAISLHSAKLLVLYVALIFGVAFGVVQAYAQLTRERALPYAAGVYLFPACLIDARSDQFKVYSTQDLGAVDVQGGSVRVAFSGGPTFLFACAEPAQAPGIAQEVQEARDRAMHAKATEDPKELVAVDPLHNPRFSSPVGPRDPYDMRLPPWKKVGWALALLVAAILAPTLWYAPTAPSAIDARAIPRLRVRPTRQTMAHEFAPVMQIHDDAVGNRPHRCQATAIKKLCRRFAALLRARHTFDSQQS